MLAAAEGAGVPVLLSTVASNLIDCSPFASLHAEALTEDQKAAWNGFYEEGKRLEAVASYAEALGQYADAAAIDVAHADLQFRMGRSLAAQGDWNAAREAFKRARDADGLVVRADSRINAIIREAATSGMASLVDVEASLAADFPGGIPGQALFYEHVHYTLRGNYELARLMAEKVAAALPSRITAGDEGSWAEPASCQLRLAATFWDKQRLWDEMKERLSVPPFTAQDSNPDNLAYIEEKSRENLSRVNPGFDWKLYQLATEARPEDYHMHARFGHYLLSNGAFDEAIRELQWVCNTFPDFEGGHQQLGIALFLAKRFDEAEASFQRVLELRPGYVKAEKALELIQKERS
jgi:tetratricopeptide (TPR) repeat protein